jgi:hypothetical protein
MAFGRGRMATGSIVSAIAVAVAAATIAPAEGRVVESAPAVRALVGEAPFFTPTGVDPELAREASAFIAARGLRFTPAESQGSQARELTVAVRVSEDVARTVSVRKALASVGSAAAPSRRAPALVSSTSYDLGAARGYDSFVTAASLGRDASRAAAMRDIPMADLSTFSRDEERSRPSRWDARIAVGRGEGNLARLPRLIDSPGEQTVDVGGSYRVMRNLDVRAGVRLSQDRDPIEPLTDEAQDAQAVYVGTKLRF